MIVNSCIVVGELVPIAVKLTVSTAALEKVSGRWLQNMSRVWNMLVLNIKVWLFVVDTGCWCRSWLSCQHPFVQKKLQIGQATGRASCWPAIAVFLKSTTALVDLDLSRNKFGDYVVVLAEALKENRTLKCLNLASNAIGVQIDGVEAWRGHWWRVFVAHILNENVLAGSDMRKVCNVPKQSIA